ncbi:MAG: excalibur calcium-binding domain-containing protein [Minisyncoccales bacterium]|jgi:uncharacterized protein YxeA
MKKILSIFILSIIIPCGFVFAHPGRTDANGCHTNKKTGEYHCHTQSNKVARTEARGVVKIDSFGKCGSKTYCKEMNSCEEAKYLLNTCKLTRLDGDKDGIPCELICN